MKTTKRILAGAFAAGLAGLVSLSASAQLPENLRDFPLATRGASGESVAPMFNGWIRNDDGSVTMIFGFANQNREAVIDVPLGPNNKIEPAEFDGGQPTHFPVYQRRGFVGIQERGSFAINVPADKADTDVVWTLTSGGQTWSVPGRTSSTAYEMSNGEAAMGTLKPAIKFSMSGAESNGVVGIYAPRINTSVGSPVTLTAYVQDRGVRAAYPQNKSLYYPLGTEWIMHQGPVGASPKFSEALITGADRANRGGESSNGSTNGWEEVTTQATFSTPGDYIIRLRVDNFQAPDSQFDNVCCWSNAYVPVTVSE